MGRNAGGVKGDKLLPWAGPGWGWGQLVTIRTPASGLELGISGWQGLARGPWRPDTWPSGPREPVLLCGHQQQEGKSLRNRAELPTGGWARAQSPAGLVRWRPLSSRKATWGCRRVYSLHPCPRGQAQSPRPRGPAWLSQGLATWHARPRAPVTSPGWAEAECKQMAPHAGQGPPRGAP